LTSNNRMFALERTPMPEFDFEIYDRAWDALDDNEKTWLGRRDFDAICEAHSEGTPPKKMHEVMGLTTSEFSENGMYRGRKLAFTHWMRRLLRRKPVRDYIEALKNDELQTWIETIKGLQPLSQNVIQKKLEGAMDSDEGPDNAAIKLAQWIAEYEMGKPESRSRQVHDIGDNAAKAADRATERVAQALSGLLAPGADDSIVDTEVVSVGGSERET
jgi:hypothetical protein